jgi:hypothetical protein
MALTKPKKAQNEQRYFDALKRITQYQSVESLRRYAERQYGLRPSEALEMAYENVIEEAKQAIKGKRRPISLANPNPIS